MINLNFSTATFPVTTSLCLRFLRSTLILGAATLTAAGLIACASGSSGGDDDSDGDDGGSPGQVDETFSLSLRTNSSGTGQATFQLAEGSTKFAVTAFVPGSSQVRFTDLFSNDGSEYLLPGGQEISFADFYSTGVNAVNAPSRDVDPNLVDGAVYTVGIEAASGGGAALSDTNIQLQITSRRDGSFSGGTVRVNLFFVGDVVNEGDVSEIIDRALDEFRSIFSSQLGIGLDVRTFSIDGPLLLPSPFDGSPLYETASRSAGGLGVNIFIGGDIAGSSGEVLGIAGGIIAPPIPSRRSALAVGIIAGAGADGVYSENDIRVLGETLAHESGHYMGLFHPVDFSGQSAVATDPLNDTDSCSSFTQCLANDSLVRNLMFVTPVGDGQGGTIPQNNLTRQQSSVINRYAAVD